MLTELKKWKTFQLQEIAEVESGGNAPQGEKYFINGKHPFVRVQHFDGSKKYIDRCNFINDEAIKKYKLKKFSKNSILFPKSGASIRLEKRALLPWDSYVVSHLCVVKPTKADGFFLYYALVNEKFAADESGSTLPFLNVSHIKQKMLTIPEDIGEQNKIGYILSIIQNAIANQEELVAKLKELKQGMMHQLFTKGVKGEKTKITEIGEVPDSWDVVELATVCDKPQYGFTDSASNNGNAKFLRITDITEDGVNWEKVPFCTCPEPEKYLLKDGDIVFARIGATTGKSFFIKNPDNAIYASYLIRVRAKAVNCKFLYYYFQTDAYWKQIDSQKGSSLKGGVNGSILSKLLIPKCSSEEQEKIATVLSAIDQKIKANQEKLSKYQNLFKTLLHELMSGERRIKHE